MEIKFFIRMNTAISASSNMVNPMAAGSIFMQLFAESVFVMLNRPQIIKYFLSCRN